MYVCIDTKDLCLHTVGLRTLTVAWVVISEVTEVHSLHSNQLEILLSPPVVRGEWESLLKSFPHLLQVISGKDHFPYWDCHIQNSTSGDAGISFHALPLKVYV